LERKAVTAVFALPVSKAVFSIEQERALDLYAREALLDRAMGPGRRRKSSEKLRRGRLPADGLAFTARDGFGNLVGTVRLWNVVTGTGVSALLLGPLAVTPQFKGAGVGTGLMRHAIDEAARLEHGAVLLVGDAPYYGRFGFSAQKTGNLSMPGPYERARFLALELTDGALDAAAGTLAASGRKVQVLRVRAAA
jgi:predicted N-acetyltransferase YhbS